MPIILGLVAVLFVPALLVAEPAAEAPPTPEISPLVIGDTTTIASAILEETRRINVFLPPGYDQQPDRRYPVLYMPDGGIQEDFLHIAGLLHISVINGTMRPLVLVGIENTERRRDLTGPTENEEDRKIAPVVGGSAAFRRFLADELIPWVEATYRTNEERAIVGESLAGLFVMETLFVEPTLFDTYLAIDPSLWWNDEHWVDGAKTALKRWGNDAKRLHVATAGGDSQIAAVTTRLAGVLEAHAPATLAWQHVSFPDERHHTIYHPAALAAFRALFPRPPDP